MEVDFASRIADASGGEPSVLILTWANRGLAENSITIEKSRNFLISQHIKGQEKAGREAGRSGSAENRNISE